MDRKMDKELNKWELIGTIIDRAEDLLGRITGSEEAVITGEDYDWLHRQIEEILTLHKAMPDPEAWYVETWCDQDIINAMEEQGVEVTPEKLEQVKEQVIPLFDDKTERNEQIADVVWELFEPAEEVRRLLDGTDEDTRTAQKK